MLKFLNNLIARFQLLAIIFNYSVDEDLDELLNFNIKVGIKEHKHDMFESKVIFNNGVEYEFWNENKYYVWLFQSKFTRNGVVIYNKHGVRPYASTMLAFKQLVDKFNHAKITETIQNMRDDDHGFTLEQQ